MASTSSATPCCLLQHPLCRRRRHPTVTRPACSLPQAGQLVSERDVLGPDASPRSSRRPLEEALTALRKVRGCGCCGLVREVGKLGAAARWCNPTYPSWPSLAPQGTLLLKHGRHGKPKVHYFRVTACDTLLRWRSASGSLKQVGAACWAVGGWSTFCADLVVLLGCMQMCASTQQHTAAASLHTPLQLACPAGQAAQRGRGGGGAGD